MAGEPWRAVRSSSSIRTARDATRVIRRLAPNVTVEVTTTTARTAPTIAERTGTALGPAPDSSAKRIARHSRRRKPAFGGCAAQLASRGRGPGPVGGRVDGVHCGRRSTTATALKTTTKATKPSPRTVQSNAILGCSTRRTGPSGASGDSPTADEACQERADARSRRTTPSRPSPTVVAGLAPSARNTARSFAPRRSCAADQLTRR